MENFKFEEISDNDDFKIEIETDNYVSGDDIIDSTCDCLKIITTIIDYIKNINQINYKDY